MSELWRIQSPPHQRTDLHYTYGAKRTIRVVPVRKSGYAWIFTDEHRAQMWAVCVFQRGHEARTIARRETKAEAEALVGATERALEGPTGYKLGKRMEKRK